MLRFVRYGIILSLMDITGARWSLSGAEAILKLRSLVKSEDFESYWLFHVTGDLKLS